MNSSIQAPPAQVRWIIWGAILMSIVVYAALPLLLPAPATAAEGGDAVFVGSFALMAVMCAAASLALRHLMLTAPLERGELDLSSAEGQARFFQVSVICWVLADAVAIWGLVLFFLGASQLVLYGFIVGAALLLGIHAPRTRARASTMDLAQPDVKIG